jgi:hypothetical protein
MLRLLMLRLPLDVLLQPRLGLLLYGVAGQRILVPDGDIADGGLSFLLESNVPLEVRSSISCALCEISTQPSAMWTRPSGIHLPYRHVRVVSDERGGAICPSMLGDAARAYYFPTPGLDPPAHDKIRRHGGCNVAAATRTATCMAVVGGRWDDGLLRFARSGSSLACQTRLGRESWVAVCKREQCG